jgi:hypothetical protein
MVLLWSDSHGVVSPVVGWASRSCMGSMYIPVVRLCSYVGFRASKQIPVPPMVLKQNTPMIPSLHLFLQEPIGLVRLAWSYARLLYADHMEATHSGFDVSDWHGMACSSSNALSSDSKYQLIPAKCMSKGDVQSDSYA